MHKWVAHVAQRGNGEALDVPLGHCDGMSIHIFVHTYIHSHTHLYTYILARTYINRWHTWRSAGMVRR